MNGHRRHAHLLQHLCQLHGVDAALVPAPSHLHRHRDRTGLHHRFGQTGRFLRILHQRRAVTVGHHFPHRAAHVDVDDLRAGHLRRDLGGLRHAGDIAAEDLRRRRMLVRGHFQQGTAFFVLIAKRFGADQLRAGVSGPQLPADLTERHVRHARHGRQRQPRRHLHISDLHRVISSAITPYACTCPLIISYPLPEKKRADEGSSAPSEEKNVERKQKHLCSYNSATIAQTAPMTALPAAIHSGGVMRKLRVGTP